jgi:propionyl-CoA synthetase
VRRSDGEIVRETIQMVRERIGAVASFRVATVVKRLPKTRSGKILRGTIKRLPTESSTGFRPPSTIR